MLRRLRLRGRVRQSRFAGPDKCLPDLHLLAAVQRGVQPRAALREQWAVPFRRVLPGPAVRVYNPLQFIFGNVRRQFSGNSLKRTGDRRRHRNRCSRNKVHSV